jgi:ATP-dependent Lon protease
MSNKKNNAKLIRKIQELARRRKQAANDGDDNSSTSGDNTSDSDYEAGNSDKEEMDVHEYRKFLQKIFPSNNLEKNIKMGEKLKKNVNKQRKANKRHDNTSESEYDSSYVSESEIENSDSESDTRNNHKKSKKHNKKNVKKSKKGRKVISDDSTSESESESENTNVYSEDDDNSTDGVTHSDDETCDVNYGGNGKKNSVNIIFTIGGLGQGEDDEEWETEEEDDDEEYVETDDDTEDEDESVSSASSMEDESNESDDSEDEKSESEVETKKGRKNCKHQHKKKDAKKKENRDKKTKKDKDNSEKNVIQEMKQLIETSTSNSASPEPSSNEEESEKLLVELKQLYENNKKNKTLQKCIEIYEKDIHKSKLKREKKQKKQKDKNTRIFRKIILDKNTTNDFTFFQKLEVDNQKKIIKELREINKISRIEKPYRMTLLESDMPTLFKSTAMKKVNSLRFMDPGSGEFYKIKNWVDTFMRIPFGKYNTLPINIDDGVEKCHDFMENAQKILNNAVYGLNDAKMQIMQLLGQLVTNPKAVGTAIAIHGPPGTGKTSLVKEGISKILNRPFAFLALGGATDSSFLEGHGYTYEGSTWGKIVQILIDSKCMNPVIYFDELDKISDTPKGEEIAGILTHLTDTTQNSQFHDKYFAEIDFDLSKCLFIFSYNDESKVNPILKDRMYRIQTKGYNQKQKTVISNDYLLPKIREQVKFKLDEIIIPETTVHYIIENLCDKEDGVRNLKRCLEIIHTKLNLYRLMKPNSNIFEEDMSLKVEFPFTVTKDVVDKLIKNDEKNKMSALYGMYV